MASWMTVCRWALVLAGLAACPAPAGAGRRFDPEGQEFRLTDGLAGDQTLPHAAVTHAGGYVVWQDNAADANGLGVRARALGADFQPAGAPFRVNVQVQGDQEKPQVALLPGGGAVFVWQGGRQGFQKVYARFLSGSGLFTSSDVRVNTYTNGFQVDPAVATLADGNVVIVWSSFGQDGSLQGIYGQRFTPLGARLGGEFPVNQYTPNNQRTPAVAALTNGHFVVVWVSELQRGAASVDVFARIFNGAGAPVTGEFPVNLSTTNPCANPSVASSRVGDTFAVAWSQNANAVAAAAGGGVTASVKSDRSWDVFARLFNLSGTALTGVVPLNTTTYGDQFAPKLTALGSEYLAVWTALGQDGSREGVFGRFLSADGSPLGDEFRVNTTTLSRQIQPAVASDEHARLVALWTSFIGGPAGFDLHAQRYATADVVPLELLTNNPPAPGGGAGNSAGLPRLEFPTPSDEDEPPLPDGFARAAGNYQGLFCEKDGVRAGSAGCFSAQTTAKATYSGKLQLAGRSWSFKGTFDASGWGSSVILRSGQSPLTVYLQLDLAGGDQIQGGVSDGDWWADLRADRAVFHKTTNPTPRAGKYTLVLPGGDTPASPAGDGCGTVTVDAAGSVKWAGTLADGTKVTQTGLLTKDGYWALYAPLYRGQGAVLGWLRFASREETDLGGPVVWLKPPGGVGTGASGFAIALEAKGSRYTPPVSGQRVLGWSSGTVTFTGGHLTAPLTYAVALDVKNKVTSLSGGGLKVTLTTSTGLFKGSLLDPVGGKPLAFQGALLQKADSGSGFFLTPAGSGRVEMEGVP